MPYITKENREKLDGEIDSLILKLESFTDDEIEGALNYTISRLVSQLVTRDKWDGFRYKNINRIMGVLECVKSEFYRRAASDYEDLAIQKNGDMREYALLEAKMDRLWDELLTEKYQ